MPLAELHEDVAKVTLGGAWDLCGAVMARTTSRPLAEIPRYLLTRHEAATALGMSLPTFERRVQPHLKLVRIGQLVLVSPRELERWVREHERYTVKP